MTRLIRASLVLFALLPTLPGSVMAAGSRDALSDDGREVLLKPDGTWVFRSNDRFANTSDGQRVRLNDDGTWELVGNAPRISEAQVRTTDIDIQLVRAVIEKQETKLTRNTRVTTQSVFHLRVKVSPQAGEGLRVQSAAPSKFSVKDNRNNVYPVLTVRPESADLQPGSEQTFVVRADDSPSILTMANSMSVEVAPGVFGNAGPILFNYSLRDIEYEKVDRFE